MTTADERYVDYLNFFEFSWHRPEGPTRVWRVVNGRRKTPDGEIPRFSIQEVSKGLEDEVIDFMVTHLFADEPVQVDLGTGSDPFSVREFRTLWRDVVSQVIGVVALKLNSDPNVKLELVGANLLNILTTDDESTFESLTRFRLKAMKKAMAVQVKLTNETNIPGMYGVDKYLTSLGLSVHPSFRGQGLGKELLQIRMGSNAKASEGIGRIFNKSSEYIEYIVLPDDRIEEALALQEDTSRRENINAGFGLHDKASSVAELNSICREIIKDRCTVVALDTRIDQIVGVCFNKIHVVRKNGELDSFEEFVKNNIREEASLGVMDFIASMESRVDLFRHYNAHSILELFYAGTDSRFSKCGIGLNLVKASIELGRALGKLKSRKSADGEAIMAPEVVFGIFTSNFSQRIASRLNFDWLATIPYDEYLYHGRKLSERIDENHKTARLGALRITLSDTIINSYS